MLIKGKVNSKRRKKVIKKKTKTKKQTKNNKKNKQKTCANWYLIFYLPLQYFTVKDYWLNFLICCSFGMEYSSDFFHKHLIATEKYISQISNDKITASFNHLYKFQLHSICGKEPYMRKQFYVMSINILIWKRGPLRSNLCKNLLQTWHLHPSPPLTIRNTTVLEYNFSLKKSKKN